MHLGKYLKAAFLNRWNLLFFMGGLGFAFLTGHADVFAPLVLAGEMAYVGLLGTHSRFQSYIEAQEAKAARKDTTESAEDSLRRILSSLPQKSLERFESLRSRCTELRQIAVGIKDPAIGGSESPLEEMQVAGLDRLLWIFLRLLYTQASLERFLSMSSEEPVKQEIERLEARLGQLVRDAGETQQAKMQKAIEDNLATLKARLANFRNVRDQNELVKLEIDRLENKIHSLSELAVNRQEPDFITGQVDQVAASMVNTERTMQELQFATGIEIVNEAVPDLLKRQTLRTRS
ncbi:MAG TPA: hypothetical protein VMT52_04675 [Planctomycetota bacterium]|nr:hypothetical protein [Planctomycetota bacterium]